MAVDLAAERAAMFEHVWRRDAETFYRAGYHGADWDGLQPVYEKYLPASATTTSSPRCSARCSASSTSATAGRATAAPWTNADETASLGVFYDPDYAGPGVKIAEVIAGGPLDKAGLNVGPGTVIEAIDGEAIAADKDLERYLNRKAGKNVLLAVSTRPTARGAAPARARSGQARLAARGERPALPALGPRNQDEVDRLSGGRLGYIHVPGMNDGAYRTAFEEVLGKFADKDGLVVDTRFNGGGDLVADLAMFLSGKKFFDYTTDTRSNGYEPNFRWTKPSISIVDEANYSDGHCYAFAYQFLKLGQARRHARAGHVHVRRLGDARRRHRLGRRAPRRQGARRRLPREPPDRARHQGDERRTRRSSRARDQQLEAAVAELLKEIK